MKKLNVGCGKDVRSGYVNVDARRLDGIDATCEAWDLPFGDGEFDEVLAHDVLEHVPKWRQADTLKEWRRVLAEGGRLLICTPNLDAIARARVEGRIGAPRFESLLFGGRDYPENQHLCGFTKDMLAHALAEAGFSRVDAWRRTEPVSEFNQCVQAMK